MAPTGTPDEYLNYVQVTDSDQHDPDSTPNDDSTTEDDDDTEPVTPKIADLSLVKTVNDATPNVGDVVTFTITVSNAGPDAATGVSVEDAVPVGYSNISNISGGGTESGGVITWTGQSIASGGTLILTFEAEVLAPTGTPDEYLNYVQVTDSDQHDPDSTPNDDSTTEDDDDTEPVTPKIADLSLVKTVNDATPNVGDVVTFTITVSNAGPDAATGVSVTDLLPVGYTNITNISSGGSISSNEITWNGLNIGVGGSIVLTFEAEVLAPTGTPDEYLNYVQVTDSDQHDPDSTPNDDSTTEDDDDTEPVTPKIADLSLVKTVNDATPNVGDVVTFTITVSNAGPDAATGVSIEDAVPVGYSNISNISGGGTESGGVITWTGQSIASGGTLVLTFEAEVLAPTGTADEYLNYVQVTDSDQHDPDSTPNDDSTTEDDDDTEPVTPKIADLSLVKTVNDATPNVGDVVTFTITVSNAGPDAATGVSVTDLLPVGYTNIMNISSGGSISSNEITWSGLNIGVGGSIVLTFEAEVLAPTGTADEYLNYVQVTDSDQHDPDSTPNDDSTTEDDDDTEPVTPKIADLSLVKTVNDATPNVGDVVTFTITVSNAGPDAATGVSVTDLLPVGYTNITNISSGGSISSNEITWNGLNIGVGGSIVLTFEAEVLAPTGTPDEYLNYVQVTDSDQHDPDSTPNDDSTTEDDDDTEPVTPKIADLSLVKTVNDATPNVGDVVTFTITVSNAGPDAATGVSVTDLLPVGYTNITNISSGGSISSNEITWSGLNIGVGGNIVLTFEAEVLAPTGTADEYLNYVQVTDSDQHDPDSTPNDDSTTEDDDDTEPVTPLSSISGNVSDTDGNPLSGVTVFLYEDSNNDGFPDPLTGPILTTMTNSSGDYEFVDLPPGNYVVSEVQPINYTSESDSQSADNDVAGNSNTLDDYIAVTLVAGEDDIDNDFVEQGNPGMISGNVYDDNGDPIPSVTISLYPDTDMDGQADAGSIPLTTTTNGSGYYEFLDVPVGNYVIDETQPANYGNDYDEDVSPDSDVVSNNNTTDDLIPVTITPAELDIDNNFYETLLPGNISGTVLDSYGDPIPNVTISLYPDADMDGVADVGSIPLTTTTNESGYYEFTNIPLGDYVVVETQPLDYSNVSDSQSSDGDAVTNTNTLDDIIPVTLTTNEFDIENDFVEIYNCIELEAWVYLEGSAIIPDGSDNYVVPMRTDLNGYGLLPGQTYIDFFTGTSYNPPGQPYDIAPWNYMGNEGDGYDSGGDVMFADAGYPPTVTDWILVSLRDTPDGSGGLICQTAALLHNNGTIEFVNDFECCDVDLLTDYYIVIEHRNHLIVMSHEPVNIVDHKISYDFRIQQSYINYDGGFGAQVGQKEILPGVYAMYAGNGNQTVSTQADTDINFDDRTYWEGENSRIGEYLNGDYNMNGDTNFNDRILWEFNNSLFTSVPRD